MSQVCKWLSFYLCMRETPKKDHIHPGLNTFDAIIVWKESPKEQSGGVAYDVILKPAAKRVSPRPGSPPKERPLSQEDIDRKLKEAEERRKSVELAKLQQIAKDQERASEARKKIEEANSSFSKESEKRLSLKLENMEGKKNAQIQALQDRLRDHEKHIQDVRQNKLNQSASEVNDS